MCSDSETGAYLRLIDFVYHSTLGLRVMKKKKKKSELLRATLVWFGDFDDWYFCFQETKLQPERVKNQEQVTSK